MNKKFLKHYMETNPEGTAQTYIFLVDNQDIALNIVMSGYQALCLVQEDDGYYFSADSFIEEMRAIQFTGSCQCAYHYVASCSVKWINDKLLTFFKDAGLDGKAGWQLFKEKEYLGKLDNQKEVEKLLEQYILRFERDPKEEPELSRFHLFDAKGNVKSVRDMEIVDYLVENVQFFVVGITPYYYEHGVFLEDHDGVRMKYRIQKLIYRDQVQSGVIKRIYNLLITQPKVHREAYELNKQPVRWINFKNGYCDPVKGEMLEHNPDYLTINQIPFPYYPEDREQVLQGGENIKKYLASSLPNKEEQQTFWEYFGYCMIQDTQFQKFLTLKGNGGTGKSVAVSLIQHVVGITNMSSISLQDLNKRFYATGMYYQIGEEHKEFCAEKTQDEDYYVLTLAAIAKELDGKGMNRAKVHIAAGLPLTWVATQKEDFQKYLLQNECVDFTFRNKEYHVEFAGADIYPQGFAAAFYRLQDFKGINMLADIGNGTMNIMYINNSRPLEKKCFTEKYGTHQCVLAVRESLLKELGTVVDDLVIEQVIRTGTADIGEKYLSVIRKAAGDYTKEIFHKLREREYNPELMRLYVVGGGGCMIQNFGEYDKNRVTIVRDICATAKGYEAMTVRKIQRNGGMLV